MEAIPESSHLRRECRTCQVSSGPCRPNLWCHPPPASMDLKAARCLGWRAAPDEGMGVNWSNPLLAQVCWTRPLEKGALTLASQLRQGEGQRRLGEALKIREIDSEEYVLSDKDPHVTYHVTRLVLALVAHPGPQGEQWSSSPSTSSSVHGARPRSS